MPRYEIVNGTTGQSLSKHRTRQGAIDTWRQQHRRIPVQVWRRYATGEDALVVEGTWWESGRSR